MACTAPVTANNGGFLIELVLNNSLVDFLDEYKQLYYPAMFSSHSSDDFDGFCDWNPSKHMTHVTNNLSRVSNQFRYIPVGIYWILNTSLMTKVHSILCVP